MFMEAITKTGKITKEERLAITKFIKLGYNKNQISKELGRHRSNIGRELKRMQGVIDPQSDYVSQANQAQEATHKRRVKASTKGKMHKTSRSVQRYIEYMLKKKISPDLISGRLKLVTEGKVRISYETIYQWIYEERADLFKYLIKAGKHRRRRQPNKKKRVPKQPAAPKTSIEQRPEVVLKRDRIGDIEHDSIVSRQSNVALQNIVDRASRKLFIQKLEDQCAETYSEALIARMEQEYPKSVLKTGTNDNGKENANHAIIDEKLAINSYFCHPYCSSERGTVENRNAMIRRWIPKGTDLATITVEQLKLIEDSINNRPMKCNGYKTPNERWIELLKVDPQYLQQAA